MLVCICERQWLPVSQPAEGLGMRRRTGDVEKDRGHAEGNGGCCVYLHQLQRMHCHPKLGFGGGEGSISRFPVSQDPTDPFLCWVCSIAHEFGCIAPRMHRVAFGKSCCARA